MTSCRVIANDLKPRTSTLNAVWHGQKFTGGKPTDQIGTIFSVTKKKKPEELLTDERLPTEIDGQPTDVIEVKMFEAPRPIMPRVVAQDATAQENTARVRPTPGGYSIGHHTITAGTLGVWVKWGPGDEWYILSNAHVMAPHWSTAVAPKDNILQAGPHDGGRNPQDRIALLTTWGEIKMRGVVPGKKNNAVARGWWGMVKGLGDLGAWAARCPYRVRVGPRYLEQPWDKNRVDGALAEAIGAEFAHPEIHLIGQPLDWGNAHVGGFARKNGRTTDLTELTCTGVDGVVDVSYGGGQVGEFENQDIYVHRDGVSSASAGGDSGSGIASDDGAELWSLLYAGGPQNGGPDITIANKSSDVLALFGNGLRLS